MSLPTRVLSANQPTLLSGATKQLNEWYAMESRPCLCTKRANSSEREFKWVRLNWRQHQSWLACVI